MSVNKSFSQANLLAVLWVTGLPSVTLARVAWRCDLWNYGSKDLRGSALSGGKQ